MQLKGTTIQIKDVKKDLNRVRFDAEISIEKEDFSSLINRYSKEWDNECIVAGCFNKRAEGEFKGPICMSCYSRLMNGEFFALQQKYTSYLKHRLGEC